MTAEVRLLSHATANPPRVFSQEECLTMAGYESFPEAERRRNRMIFRAAGVQRRALWLDGEQVRPSADPDDFHRRYVTGVRAIAPLAARRALALAELRARDIDYLVFASCTGYTCPGFGTELAVTLGLPDDAPAASLLGMGCSALVPALQRGWERALAVPGTRALVIAAEICSSTYWIDGDAETCVGNAIFGDGAAALVLSSHPDDAARAVARVDSFSGLRDGRHLDDMGFTTSHGRLRVRLAREVPEHIVPLAARLLAKLDPPASARLIFHPGGKKILDLLEPVLREKGHGWEDAVGWSRDVLRNHGNMSSPTAAFVLARSLEVRPAVAGESCLLMTMGPGLAVESARLTWLRAH